MFYEPSAVPRPGSYNFALELLFLHNVLHNDSSNLLLSFADGAVTLVVVLAIAEAHSLDVIVEGAETRAQAELLVELCCLVAQGFYLDRPRSADDLGSSAQQWPRSTPV
jgi:EAL domain-containing protein (putative c-di-GMP-specific phosphodiesterase class I)